MRTPVATWKAQTEISAASSRLGSDINDIVYIHRYYNGTKVA